MIYFNCGVIYTDKSHTFFRLDHLDEWGDQTFYAYTIWDLKIMLMWKFFWHREYQITKYLYFQEADEKDLTKLTLLCCK